MLYFSTDGCINKSLTYLLTYLLTYIVSYVTYIGKVKLASQNVLLFIT